VTPLPPNENRPIEPSERLGAATGQVLAWATFGVFNAITIAIQVPFRRGYLGQRVSHHAHDAGQMLAIGLASCAAVALWARAVKRLAPGLKPRAAAALDLGAIAIVALILGFRTLGEDLGNFADRLIQTHDAGRLGPAVLPLLIVAFALTIPAAAALGRLLARPWLRWPAVVVAAGLGVANEVVLQNDYRGVHLLLALTAAALGSSALATLPLPTALLSRRARAIRLGFVGIFTVIAGYGILIWPGSRVMSELYKVSGAVLTPYLAAAHQARESAIDERLLPENARPWFADRAGMPDVPPTAPPSAMPDRIVILLFIDSFRADVLASPRNAAALPTIFDLKSRSVYFPGARSPGSGTVFSFSQIFSSRYFSQMYWSPRVAGGGVLPHADPSPRFPELLVKAGIPTYTSCSIEWLNNESGVVRGFSEEKILPFETPRLPVRNAIELVDDAIDRLGRWKGGPMFLFFHFMDAHYPYDRAGKTGPEEKRYIGEIGLIDKELGRLRAAIVEKGLAPHTMTILTADHGEAFGEHHTTQHGSTMYDELLRVPLVIESPDLPPHAVPEAVSLMDLGPTILDLLGQPTPGTYMGQSLVPLLRGGHAELSRPIVAESRLMRALLFPDGFKVITDPRKGTTEVYDLNHDPGELTDLYDDKSDVDGEKHVGALDHFFRAQSLKRKGYVPPYRP
jgi:hypothetical protein